MWCKDCRQDVPALLSGDKQTFCCPRCGGMLCAESGTGCQPVLHETGSRTGWHPVPRPCYDDWETGEELSEIGRALRSTKHVERQAKAIYRRESMRFDQPHADLPLRHAPAAEQPSNSPLKKSDSGSLGATAGLSSSDFREHLPCTAGQASSGTLFQRAAKRRKTVAEKRGAAPSALTWLSLALGTIGFVCGGVLMGWSLATGRQEFWFWTIGAPVALVGQIALLVGMVLQLDRMRRDNRRAATKLDNVDEQLRDLKTTTTLLSTSHGPASTTFYSHFAGGASPQLLLTDLKSQLDLLAMRIAQDE